MAERTAEQVRTRLKNQLIYYDPGFHVSGESPYDVPPEYRQIIGGALGTRQLTPEEAASAAGVSIDQLRRLEPGLDLGANERSTLLQKYVTPAGGTGFFSSLLSGVGGVVGGLTDTVINPVANALNVHPDAVKAAAALAGLYYGGEGLFFDAATNAVVPEAVATDMIAATLGAESLAVPAAASAAAPAAGATLGAAELAALDAGLGGLPAAAPAAAPAATAFPVATAPLAPINSLGSAGIDASLGQAYNALGVGANALSPAAGAAALSPEVLAALSGAEGLAVPASAFTGAATLPAAATLSPEFIAGLGGPETLAAPSNMGFGTPVGYGGAGDVLASGNLYGPTLPNLNVPTNALISGYGGAGDVLSPANLIGPPNVGANILTGYGGAGDVLSPVTGAVVPSSNLPTLATGAAAPASAAGPTLAGYGGAGDVLNPVTGVVTTGADAATGLAAGAGAGAAATGAGAGAAGTGAGVAGYGGAGDVLNPATGAVITGADAAAVGLSASAFDTLAKFARDYGVPLSSLISGITGSQAAKDAANVQAESAREARALARQIFDEQKALQEPFRTAGISAQNQLLTLLGLPGGTQGAEFGRYARPFGMQDFQADPGYAFRLSEGMKALEASRAARGGLLSGATGKALSRYGQDLASQEYGNAFNRYQTERVNRLQPLGALMGTGQAAASNQGAAAGQYGQTAGALTTDIGAARAAGDVGAANAITNALGQYSRYLSNQNMVNALQDAAVRRASMYGPAIPV